MRFLLIIFSLLLASCAATSELLPPTRADTVIEAANLPSVGKLVFRGPVTIQVASGPNATQTASTGSKDKTGQRAQAVSTGDGSPIKASAKTGGVLWWVYLLVAVVGAAGWQWVRSQAAPLKWLPWRARPG